MKTKLLAPLTFLALLTLLALLTTACGSVSKNASATSPPARHIDFILDRDKIICGGRDDLPGFASIDANGRNIGFDVDFCRVIAAAVLGDAEKIEMKIVTTPERFDVLASGEIDVLLRNSTWTATRDGKLGASFIYTTYYDGQAFMVAEDSGINTLEELANTTICVAPGSTTILNLEAVLNQRGINYTSLERVSVNDLVAAYTAGECQAYTSNTAILSAHKNQIETDTGKKHKFLDEKISKEPGGPYVQDNDWYWEQIVRWAVMSTIQAWEFGITSQNIETYANTNNINDPNIANFLGKEGYSPRLGLEADFVVDVISQVGNYEEIYNRNLLDVVGVPLAGSVNNLWTNGGLHYVPPYR